MSSLLRALFTGTSKHKKLSEEWATLREPVVEGVTFYCKYLGSTLVADPKGEAATAEAIKRIIHTAKQLARKPERVALHVSLKGIRMEDTLTKKLLIQTSIYKISYCSADAHYDHVFAFIATTDNENCECHAFLCPKRKMAQEVTISIAQAFNLAYECWKMSIENKESEEAFGHEELPAEVTVGSASVHGVLRSSQSQPSSQASSPIPIRSDFGSSDMSTSGYQSSSQALLIDLEDSSEHHPASANTNHSKVAALAKPLSDLDDLGDISDGFSRRMLQVCRQSCGVQSGVLRPVLVHQCLSSTSGHSQRPKRKAKKHTSTTIVRPEEAKCDCIGSPDTLSNLRPIKFYVPPDETSLERSYRESRTLTQEWNQAFWAQHNASFKKMREEFIQRSLKEKYGDSEGKKTLTADEMSKFYKSFLDEHLNLHKEYNKEWYKRNIRNLILSARVWVQQKLNSNR